MRILLDHNVPAPLTQYLAGHECLTAKALGWDELQNGFLLSAAESAGFDLLLTGDKRMRYQQNFSHRRISLIVLGNISWPVMRRYIEGILDAVNACAPGSFAEVDIPFR